MRKTGKVLISLMLVLVMLCSVVGAMAYTAGTYEAEAQGNNGPVKVQVTFDGDTITQVEVIEQSETEGIREVPIGEIPAAIVAHQSLNIDTISGATNTSKAILAAVEDCVRQAGGDVEALKQVEVTKEKTEDFEGTYDVVVVGGGGAGLAAALSASENGASVVLIEKAASLGGNSLLAGGAFNACDPERQAAVPMSDALMNELKSYLAMDASEFGDFAPVLETVKGQIEAYLAGDTTYIFDSPELHQLQIYLGGKRTGLDGTVIVPNVELAKVLTGEALSALEWVTQYGAEWNPEIYTVLGAMWPRTHSLSTGKITVTMENAARERGVEILTSTEGTSIIMDGGKAVGIEAITADGAKVTLHADKGVVMATGGYAANAPMVVQYNNYWEGLMDTMPSTNATSITGDGILMAQEVGANVVGMGYAQLMPSSHPVDGSLFSGIWGSAETQVFVNKEGKRYVNEYAERDVLARAALEQTDGLFFIICDNKIAQNADVDGMVKAGNVVVSDTLQGLAEQLGIPADAFVAEIERYNSFVDAQKDDDFGKPLFGEKIDEAPFVATPRSPSLHHTMGGLEIDVDAQVIDTNGQPIDGLYAAGEICGGIHAGNRLGGNAMTEFLVFGRIAGANAAK